jgi:hypothetical protein
LLDGATNDVELVVPSARAEQRSIECRSLSQKTPEVFARTIASQQLQLFRKTHAIRKARIDETSQFGKVAMNRQFVQMLENDPVLAARVTRLMSIPGVGIILALTWALESVTSRGSPLKRLPSLLRFVRCRTKFCRQVAKNANIEAAKQAPANHSYRSCKSCAPLASRVCVALRPGRAERQLQPCPQISAEIRRLIRHMAAENPTWGEERIADELLLKLHVRLSSRTVGKYIQQQPRPRGSRDQLWSTFVWNHAHSVVACDFFVSVTASFPIFYVFVALEVGSRRLVISLSPNIRLRMDPAATTRSTSRR